MLKHRLHAIIGVVAMVGIWWLVTATGLVRPLFLPSPGVVIEQCVRLLVSGELFDDLVMTLLRLVIGLALGIAVGVPLGLLMGSSDRVYRSLEVVMDFFRSVPVAALFPLFILVFGVGDASKVATTAYSTSLIILINTIYGVHNASAMRRRVAVSLGANRMQIFLKVTLPDALPAIAAGVRTALSLGLIVVLVTEMFLGTRTGLGQRIYVWSMVYRVPEMYAAILTTGILGYVLNKVFVFGEKRIIHWRGLA